MKKGGDKDPMFKVVKPPRSKRSKNEREQEERRKRTQPPAWKLSEAKERAIAQKIEENEREGEMQKQRESNNGSRRK